jgi:hypothetical protein
VLARRENHPSGGGYPAHNLPSLPVPLDSATSSSYESRQSTLSSPLLHSGWGSLHPAGQPPPQKAGQASHKALYKSTQMSRGATSSPASACTLTAPERQPRG